MSSLHMDIFIEHNPPMSLDNRYDASLVDSGDVKKSRVGPVIYLEEIIENSSIYTVACRTRTVMESIEKK